MNARKVTVAGTAWAAALAICAAALSSCASQPQPPTMPANHLTCTTFKAGTIYAYQLTPAGDNRTGIYHILSGSQCEWAFPSAYENGSTQMWPDPPISLVITSRKRVELPGNDEVLFVPAGSQVKVAGLWHRDYGSTKTATW